MCVNKLDVLKLIEVGITIHFEKEEKPLLTQFTFIIITWTDLESRIL